MNDTVRSAIEGQFLAAIDMLANAMDACPEELWSDATQEPQFWYLAYHTVFWLDCYLTGSADAYRPPPPFGLEEMDPAGVMPPRVYSRDELRPWLAACRARCATPVGELSDANASDPAGFAHQGLNRLEHVLYNMRHVQHHAAQLNLILRQRTDSAPGWVRRGR